MMGIYIYDDGSRLPGLPLHWVGPAAFQFRVSLTIELRVAVHHRGDADEHLPPVSLHHQLQLPARLLDQFPRVAERQVLRHRPVDLTNKREIAIGVAPKNNAVSLLEVMDVLDERFMTLELHLPPICCLLLHNIVNLISQ